MGRYSGRSFRLIFMSIVSILLFVMELVIAHMGNSLSLASDAFAVLSHVLSMIIGLFGLRASNIRQHRKSTYGFLRADVVGAFGNSIFAMALMFSILVEAIKRYINPQKTELPLLVLSAGIIGLFFNVLNYVILDCCYCTAHRPLGDPETGTLNTFLTWGAYVCIFYQVPPVFATAVNCVRWVQSYACLCLKCPMGRMYVMRAPRVCVKYKKEQTRN